MNRNDINGMSLDAVLLFVLAIIRKEIHRSEKEIL